MKSKLSATRCILGHGRLGLTILGAVWMVSASPAMADLIGTSVSGVMNVVGGSGTNSFDPAAGFVPSGFGNSAPHGPNNVVIGSGIEFGFMDSGNTDTVDFTSTQVTLKYVSVNGSLSVVYSFTDTAFAGATISLVSNNFPLPVTETLVGNVLSLTAPIFLKSAEHSRLFSISPPLPSLVPSPVLDFPA